MNLRIVLRTINLISLFFTLGPLTSTYASNCTDNVILGDQTYIAASSAERGYLYYEESQPFQDYIAQLVHERGQKICALKGCGKLAAEPATTLSFERTLTAVLVDHNHYDIEYFKTAHPWVFSNAGYQWLGDILWYGGHILSCGSVLSSVTIQASIPMVLTGQIATMLSRPVGRIAPREISCKEGLECNRRGQTYGTISKTFESRRPHEIFTSVQCLDPEPAADVRIEIGT